MLPPALCAKFDCWSAYSKGSRLCAYRICFTRLTLDLDQRWGSLALLGRLTDTYCWAFHILGRFCRFARWCKIAVDWNANISDPRALHIHGLAPVKMQKLCWSRGEGLSNKSETVHQRHSIFQILYIRTSDSEVKILKLSFVVLKLSVLKSTGKQLYIHPCAGGSTSAERYSQDWVIFGQFFLVSNALLESWFRTPEQHYILFILYNWNPLLLDLSCLSVFQEKCTLIQHCPELHYFVLVVGCSEPFGSAEPFHWSLKIRNLQKCQSISCTPWFSWAMLKLKEQIVLDCIWHQISAAPRCTGGTSQPPIKAMNWIINCKNSPWWCSAWLLQQINIKLFIQKAFKHTRFVERLPGCFKTGCPSLLGGRVMGGGVGVGGVVWGESGAAWGGRRNHPLPHRVLKGELTHTNGQTVSQWK